MYSKIVLALVLAAFGCSFVGCGGQSQHYIQKPTGEPQPKKKKKRKKRNAIPAVINSPNKSERIVEADDPVEVDKDGNAAITIEELVDFDSCFVEINYLPDRNLSSVQIRSYESRDKMTFPAFFAYATVDDQLINTLIGQTLDCRIFIQLEKEGAIWSTRNNETVRIQVNAVTPQLVARLLPATLKATGHGRVAEASGTITAFRTDRSEANENEAANENQ